MTIQPPNLRPLKAGEILDRAFRLYRANFGLFIGIAGILLGPLLMLELLSLFIFQDTILVSYIQSFLINCLLNGAMVWAASRLYLGLPIFINDAYSQAQHRFWTFLGANFRQGLAYLPIFILAGIGVIVLSLNGVNETLGVTIPMLFVTPYIFFFLTRWGVFIPTILIENLDAAQGLKRSWTLTSKNFWHVFLVVVASYLLSYLMASLPSVMIDYAIRRFAQMSLPGYVLSSLISQLGVLISTPLMMSIMTILYYDLRVRHEGYDLELALEDADEKMDILDEQALPDPE